MSLRKSLSVVLAVCLLLGLAAVCGLGPASAAPVKDTVIITQTEEPAGFLAFDQDYVATQNKDALTLGNIYDRLMDMGPDGSITLSLATEYSISDDGLEYTFKLRDDVFFHNGYKMTAEDVAFSYNYCLENYPVSARTMLTNLERAEAVDEYTVKLILREPFASFINCPTSRVGGIVSKKLFEEVGFETYLNNPVGTGPYKFVSRVSGESITLAANDKYWGGVPSIKNVIIKPISNVSTQFLSLENGELDVIINSDIGSCLQMTNPNLKWSNTQSAGRTHLLFFSDAGWLLNDSNLRKAIQAGINKEELVVGAMDGYGLAMDYDVVPIYNDAPDPSTIHVVPYDVNKAKEHLAASNYEGQALKLVVTSGTFEEKLAQIIQGQMLAVGVNVEVVPVDSGTRLTMANTGEGIDMYIQTSVSSLNDVSGIATQYRSSTANVRKWTPDIQEEFDRLLRLADTEMDHSKRKEHVAQILNIINDQALTIPLVSPVVAAAYNTDLKGLTPHFATWFPIKSWSW